MRANTAIPLSLVLLVASPTLCGQGGPLYDYRPTNREVILNTDFTQITPVGAAPYNVTGGVFLFRNVTIPIGVHVIGVGSNPMIWIVTGTFRVDGQLTVDGGNGGRVDTLNSTNFATPGGVGACTGGDGGKGSPNILGHSFAGEQGFGPMNTPFLGGRGGVLGFNPVVSGSGGGGGVFATAGDPYYRAADGLPFTQQLGYGGKSSRTPWNAGGAPGVPMFTDGRAANDFFGTGYDLNRRIVINGELGMPIGGQGGAGGGDYIPSLQLPFIQGHRGGGGGGAGGVLIVFAVGKVIVGPVGEIRSNGGNGGGGEPAGSNSTGGGGGGGSGGMVIIASRSRVELHAHGETFANQDYRMSLSADGGVCLQGRFLGSSIERKYPPQNASVWAKPSGGFGGLGIIQIFTPIGTNTDGTNTIFDDSIDIIKNGVVLQGGEKQRYIAWRGYPDASGMLADDAGRPTNIGNNAGDIRPTPILLPLF